MYIYIYIYIYMCVCVCVCVCVYVYILKLWIHLTQLHNFDELVDVFDERGILAIN